MRRLLVLALAAAFAAAADAQLAPPRQDLGDKIMREQMEKERERILQRSAPRIETGNLGQAADVDPDSVADPEPTFLVERIELTGSWPGAPGDFERAVRPFAHRRLGVNRINLLLSRLNVRLVDAGYITSRAYVSDQNLAAGTLRLTVVPGIIETLRYDGADLPAHGWDRPGLRLALPFAAGDILYLRDIEQGIDQLNRLRGNNVEVKIEPGAAAGGSIVDIVNKPGRRWQALLGVDNQGSEVTGMTRYRASVDAGNLLGMMENLSVGYTGSLDTNALNASLSIPFGYGTMTLLETWSEYQSLIGTTALMLGTSRNEALAWNYLFHRDRDSKAAFDLSLSRRSANRNINNLELLPQRLAVLRAGANRLRRFAVNQGNGQWTLDLGISQGLARLGADRDAANLPAAAARSQFTKVDVAGALLLPIAGKLSWRGSVSGQTSRVPLFSSEQLFAGGVATVRGFAESAVGGDRGWLTRNEIVHEGMPPFMSRYKADPFLYCDAARVTTLADGRKRSLAAVGAGLRLNLGSGGLELLFGRPIAAPADLPNVRWRLNAALTWMI